jgi:hypothetical protein
MLTPWSVTIRHTAPVNANGCPHQVADLGRRLHVVVGVVGVTAERRRQKSETEVVIVGPVRPRQRSTPPTANVPTIVAPIWRRWRHAQQQHPGAQGCTAACTAKAIVAHRLDTSPRDLIDRLRHEAASAITRSGERS